MPDSKQQSVHGLRQLLLIVAFITGGIGIGGWLYAVRSAPPRRHEVAAPLLVNTRRVRVEDVTCFHNGYGVVRAETTATVSAEVASTVRERVGDVREGSPVAAGQPILRLDAREYRYALDRARAHVEADEAALRELEVEAERLKQVVETAEQEYRVAVSEYERVSGLFERDLAAEKEMNVATQAYQSAKRVLQGYQRELARLGPRREQLEASRRAQQAAAEQARLNVERCNVVSPIEGVIRTLTVDVGDRVAPGTPLATIVDARRVEIPVRLPAAAYVEVRPGAACRLESESLPGVAWEGHVARVAPTIDETTRTFAVYLVVDNRTQPRPLVPGMFVRATVAGADLKNVLLAPRGAIRDGYVFVVRDGVVHREPVTVDRFVVERAVVRGALRDGDLVAISNLDVLIDGAAVRIAEEVDNEPLKIRDDRETRMDGDRDATASETGSSGHRIRETPSP